jgi:hypothetical protein
MEVDNNSALIAGHPERILGQQLPAPHPSRPLLPQPSPDPPWTLPQPSPTLPQTYLKPPSNLPQPSPTLPNPQPFSNPPQPSLNPPPYPPYFKFKALYNPLIKYH